MARYIRLSIPQGEAERLVDLAKSGAHIRAGLGPVSERDERIIRRIQAALRGRDLRVHNSHNTHKVKRPRVELDLRRKAS